MINGVYKPTYNWGGTILYWQYTDNTQLTKNEWTSLLLQILGHARPLNDGQLVWGVAPQLGICTAKIFEALFSSSKFLHKSSSKSSKSSNRLATSHNTGNRSDGSDFLRYRPSGGHSPWTDRWKHRTRFSRAWEQGSIRDYTGQRPEALDLGPEWISFYPLRKAILLWHPSAWKIDCACKNLVVGSSPNSS